MKIRKGFVSNSSSSSFVIIKAGDTVILEDGNSEYLETCGDCELSVDDLITKLQEAKANGIEVISITHGGGYDG